MVSYIFTTILFHERSIYLMLGVNVIMVNGVTVGPNAAVQALREGLGRVLEAGAQV